jgi:peptide deformylase
MQNFIIKYLNPAYVFLLVLIITLSSCGVGKQFSEIEKKLISEKTNKPMRVFLITNKSDSTLLRKKSKPIQLKKEFDLIKKLANRMVLTVKDSASLGVGIAAPQVGVLKQMIVVQRLDKDNEPFEVYINPKINKYSKKKRPCPEGCLSIPNKRAITLDRAYTIWLEYETLNGNKIKEEVSDFVSVIFQHEIDHLNGILFIDHLLKEIENTKRK